MDFKGLPPGKGEVDIPLWVKAVKGTGYDGVWCPELLGSRSCEEDLIKISRDSYDVLKTYGII